jgi:hypothetical protein
MPDGRAAAAASFDHPVRLDKRKVCLRYTSLMAHRVLSMAAQKELVAQWRETGRVLDELRKTELAGQSPEQSRQAAYDMLQLGGMLPADPARESSSGLIEMQRLFSRGRSHGRT